MKKRISLIVLAFAIILAMVIPSNISNAKDKEVLTVNVEQEDGKLKVSGTVEDGMLAVAVQVIDENDKIVAVETGAIDEDNKYEVTIDIEDGKYTVKVADYDGGNFKTVKMLEDGTTEEVVEDTTTSNVKTGDNIVIFAGILVIALIVLGFIVSKKRKTNKKN